MEPVEIVGGPGGPVVQVVIGHEDMLVIKYWLMVWLPSMFFSQKYWVAVIIPIDELILFRGVAQPPTRM